MSTDRVPSDAGGPGPARRGSFILLAGGASRRMGLDKARAPVGGVPLLLHVLEAGRGACVEGVVVADRADRYEDLLDPVRAAGWPVREVADRRPGRGPLAGLEAGLSAASEALCFVAACDLPYLEPDLVAALLGALAGGVDAPGADGADRSGEPGIHAPGPGDGSPAPGSTTPRAVVPVRGGREQPLCAAYERRAAEVAAECLDAGQPSVHALLDRLLVRRLPESDLESLLGRRHAADETLDLDRPEELERARRRLEGPAGEGPRECDPA